MPSSLMFEHHTLRVTGSEVIEQDGKDPVIKVYVQDADDPDQVGTVSLSTSQNAFEWTEKKLNVLGWNMQENQYRIDLLNDPDNCPIRGAEFEADVVEGKPWIGQDGKERPGHPNINFSALGGFGERMSQEKAKAFSATLRARVLASKGQAAVSNTKLKKSTYNLKSKDESKSDDEVPF